MPGGVGGEGAVVDIAPQSDLSSVSVAGPTGPGWVVELAGYHFYNDPKADRRDIGSGHVRNTLLKQLKEGIVSVPLGPGMPMAQFSMKDLGIGYAILAYSPPKKQFWIPNPNYVPPVGGAIGGGVTGPGAPGGLGGLGSAMPAAGGIPGAGATTAAVDPNNPEAFPVTRYDFGVQFVWQEKPLADRLKAIKEREEAEKAKAAAAAAAAEGAAQGAQPPAGAPTPPTGVQPTQPAPAAAQPGITAQPGIPAQPGIAAQPGIPAPMPPVNPAAPPGEEGTAPPGPPAPPNAPPAPVPPATPPAQSNPGQGNPGQNNPGPGQ